jgi:uncharacterized protein (DUF2342 family)
MKKYILLALFALGSGTSFADSCSQNTPCLDVMKDLPQEIRGPDDYMKLIKMAFACVGWPMNITDELLKKEYVNLPDPKTKVRDIIAKRAADSAKNGTPDFIKPCLEAVPECSPPAPCFDKMQNIENPEITGPKNYSDILTDAYVSIGRVPPAPAILEKEYTDIKGAKDTWADVIKTGASSIIKEIIPSLNRIKPCSSAKPCFSKMQNIENPEITGGKNYSDILTDAYVSIGRVPPAPAILEKEYTDIKGAKDTWADVIKTGAPSIIQDIIPCLNRIKPCSSAKPCFSKMKNIENPQITGPKNYSDILTDAYLSIGRVPPAPAILEKEYRDIKGAKNTWADVIKTGAPSIIQDIIPCLNRIKPCSSANPCTSTIKPCTPVTPCLSKMNGIMMQIRNAKSYVELIKMAFACVGWPMNISDANLEKEYLNLKGPKSTVKDILAIRSADSAKNGKPDRIKPCLEAVKG